MKEKIKNYLNKILNKNFALKVTSLVVAVLLWFYVQIAQNPEVSYDILEVPITITGEANINSDGFVVSEIPKNLKTNVTVSVKRSMIHRLDASDLTAVVDVSQCGDTGDFYLPVKVRSNDSELTVVSKKPSNISLYIDRIITVDKIINVSFDGTLEPGYYIDKDNVSVNPSKATIKTPELESDKVSEVNVSVDMTNVKSTVTNIFQGIMVDSKGETVTDKNINFVTEGISVTVPVYKRKTVPVVIKNAPSDMEYNLSEEQIEIAGNENVISSISEIEGYIDGYDPDVKKSSYTVTLKLGNNIILPEKKNITCYPVLENEEKTDTNTAKKN